VWLTAESVIQIAEPNAPTAVNHPSVLTFNPVENSNAIGAVWEISFHRMICVRKAKNGVEAMISNAAQSCRK
jgi:hypothetical protein